MRAMTPDEIQAVIGSTKWATICTVSPEGMPYAIEATPFSYHSHLCFMVNPRGSTWRNLQSNPNVLLKFTRAADNLSWWAGVSCFGTGCFDSDPEAIRSGFVLLGGIMQADYAAAGERFSLNPKRSPMLRVTVAAATGRCSAQHGQPLILEPSAKQG